MLYDGPEEITTTLKKALSDIDPKWESYNCLIIPGSHTPVKIEQKIEAIKTAREEGTPFLGICLGHQLAAIEYARNVIGIKDATSEEFGQDGTLVVKKGVSLKIGEHKGETYWNRYYVAIGWTKPPHFFTEQYHPEYQSSKKKPHFMLVSFLKYARTN